MRASKGALTHDSIMKLSWRQFQIYLDAFTWIVREETDEGRAENAKADLEATALVSDVRSAKREIIKEVKEKWNAHKGMRERMRQMNGLV